jgi:hypothetical protein
MKKMNHQAISASVRDMVKNGSKPRMAIAASLAQARKTMMAEPDQGTAEEAGEPVYPKGTDETGLSENVLVAEAMADGLQERKYAANDNTVSYESDTPVQGHTKIEQGQRQAEAQPEGSKPSQLSDVATAELAMRKARRNYR